MLIDVVTLFPNMFSCVLNESILKRAQNKGLIKIRLHNLRDYTPLAHGKVDAPPFGGGPGMVIRPEPIFNCVEKILGHSCYPEKKQYNNKKVVFFTPQGKILTQQLAKKYLNYEQLILIAGRYEGIDQRVRDYLVDEEISLGDYLLTGGELACMVFIDVLTRIIPGVVSCSNSISEESFEKNLLDYPHYTKPRNFRGLKVPEELLSGNHKLIGKWRKKMALENTRQRRPDLLANKQQDKQGGSNE